MTIDGNIPIGGVVTPQLTNCNSPNINWGNWGIPTPFDPAKDYFAELRSDEKYVDNKSGNEYPYLRGLQRLAHNNRGGVLEVDSRIISVPSLHKENKDVQPNCIAAVTVTYTFKDGCKFSGSADASFKAHEHPFNLHLVAVAESKAEARAIRRAFNITKVAREEIGSADAYEDNEPISDPQIAGIKKIAKRKGLSESDVLKLIKREDITNLTELSLPEGREAIKAVNKYKG